jgi:hypothetical protein
MRDIDRAVLTASEVVKDFAKSDVGKRLSPAQLVAVMAIASAEEADRRGSPVSTASQKLREVADALDLL